MYIKELNNIQILEKCELKLGYLPYLRQTIESFTEAEN